MTAGYFRRFGLGIGSRRAVLTWVEHDALRGPEASSGDRRWRETNGLSSWLPWARVLKGIKTTALFTSCWVDNRNGKV